ncbi:MAG: hypothetical protein AAFQ89_14925 [Cyanobacteria bacterium J06626_18]
MPTQGLEPRISERYDAPISSTCALAGGWHIFKASAVLIYVAVVERSRCGE